MSLFLTFFSYEQSILMFFVWKYLPKKQKT